jgi:hypothetical protein
MTPKVVHKFLKMPGVRDVEDFCRFGVNVNKDDTRSLLDRCDALTTSLFGITRDDTLFVLPERYVDGSMPFEERLEVGWDRDDHEAQFDCEKLGFDESKIDYLLRLGWDLRDERGQPLHITRWVCRVIEAVAKGIAGTIPEADVIDAKRLEASLGRQAEEFMKQRRLDAKRKK